MVETSLNKVFYLLIALSFVVGITIGSLNNVVAQQNTIPNWVKNTALWWGQGQINDADFIKALQYLIDNGILSVPQSEKTTQSPTVQSTTSSSFSGMMCQRDITGTIHVTGKFTSSSSYSVVSLIADVEDTNGNVLATGPYTMLNVQQGIPKIFDDMIIYAGNYAKCEIQIQNTLP